MLAVTASCTTFTSVISPYHLAPRALLCLFAKHPLSQWWMGWLREAGEECTHSNRVLVPSSGQLCSAPPAAPLKDCAMASPAFWDPRLLPTRLVRGVTGSQLRITTSSGGSSPQHRMLVHELWIPVLWRWKKKKKENRIILPKQVPRSPVAVQKFRIKCQPLKHLWWDLLWNTESCPPLGITTFTHLSPKPPCLHTSPGIYPACLIYNFANKMNQQKQYCSNQIFRVSFYKASALSWPHSLGTPCSAQCINLMALDHARQDEKVCADQRNLIPSTRLITFESFLGWLVHSEVWPHCTPYGVSDLLQHTLPTPWESRAYLGKQMPWKRGALFSVPAKFHL